MPVLDQFGNPYPAPSSDLTEEQAAPSLASIRQIHSGQVPAINPRYLAGLLTEAEQSDATRYLELAEAMEERDLHYASVLGTRKRAIRALECQVTAASEDPADEDAASLVRDALGSSAVKDDLIGMLDAIGKGYSVTEIIWATEGANWTIDRLEWRDPRWFRFDQNDGRTLLLRDDAGDLPLAPAKFICHFGQAKTGLPIRGGLARLAAWAYMFKSFSLKNWAIFAETYGFPLRLGRFGPQASDEQKRTLLRAVRQLGIDMAAIIPESMNIEVIAANAGTGSDKLFEGHARYFDEQISKAVLGQTGTTDALAGGYAVGRVHDQVRDDIRDSDAEQLAATLERDLARPLTAFNFGDRAMAPTIRFVPPEISDPRLFITGVTKLVGMGLPVSQAEAYRQLGIRPPEDGEDLLTAPSQPEPTEDAPEPRREIAAAQTPPRSSIDELVDHLIDEGHARDATETMLGNLAEAIGSAGSLDEVRASLEQFAQEAPDRSIRELIAQTSFAARLAGELGAPIT